MYINEIEYRHINYYLLEKILILHPYGCNMIV